jgi:hypothetical protein
VNFIEEIVERRIAQGVRDGVFDGLSGHGKPIEDIDDIRPEGWFANRLVRNERLKAHVDDRFRESAARRNRAGGDHRLSKSTVEHLSKGTVSGDH